MSSGLNHAQRMNAAGVDVTRGGNIYWAPPEAFTIVTDPKHFCFDPGYNPALVDRSMVDSIDEQGILEPVEAMLDGTALLIVFGRRRVAHAILSNEKRAAAGKDPRKVPYVIFKGEERDARDRIAIENFHRRIPSPSDYAARIADYRRSGYTSERIAFLLNLDVKALSSFEGLNECSPEVRREVDARELPLSAVPALRELPRAEQASRVAKYKEARAAGKSKSKAVAKAIKQAPEKERGWTVDVLKEGSMWCARVRVRGGKGQAALAKTPKKALETLAGEVEFVVGGAS